MSSEHPTAQVRPPGRFSSRGMGLFIALRAVGDSRVINSRVAEISETSNGTSRYVPERRHDVVC